MARPAFQTAVSAASPVSALPNGKQTVTVYGRRIAYRDEGEGDPIVFLHGNPTSSYLWRNLIPFARPYGRCIAPDLLGMGDSEKIASPTAHSYRFVEQRRHLDRFFDALDLNRRVVLVVHDWGSALGFDWARRNPHAVRGIVHMEAIVASQRWAEMPPAAASRFRAVRGEHGETLVLEQNMFLEQSLGRGTMRAYTEEEMAEYRRPFLEPGAGRMPTLSWARELPIDDEPGDVATLVGAYDQWLASSDVPKLYVRAEPGTHPTRMIQQVRRWPNQQEIAVQGLHYPQEDSPAEVGAALAKWLRDLR